jgi:hypothetical protein
MRCPRPGAKQGHGDGKPDKPDKPDPPSGGTGAGDPPPDGPSGGVSPRLAPVVAERDGVDG